MQQLKGISASKGLNYGPIFRFYAPQVEVKKDFTSKEKTKEEIAKAYEEVKKGLESLIAIMQKKKRLNALEILEAHLVILDDPAILEDIKTAISAKMSSQEVIDEVFSKYISIFQGIEDPYMQARVADLEEIRLKLLLAIEGRVLPDLSVIEKPSILLARDLTPSQTANIDKDKVLAFVTEIGSYTSHSAIMARNFGIPGVVGVKDLFQATKDASVLLVDGTKGLISIDPSAKTLKEIDLSRKKLLQKQAALKKYIGQTSLSQDQHQVILAANIGSQADLEPALENDAEGVGLFRSEFLYMEAENWPTEEEQYQAYQEVVAAFGKKNAKVVIRTLDIGGDKTLPYHTFKKELNPFLGVRATRFLFLNEDKFRTQLRAIIRASYYGKVAIMFPMIATVNEFLKAKAIFEKTYQEISQEKIKIGSLENIEIGLMIETPSAALLSADLAQVADFLSIGTNDLIQYSMAADRLNDDLAYLYQPLNPSVLRLLDIIIKGAKKGKAWVGMCGEMAGTTQAIPILLGLGLEEFSMSANTILEARSLISQLSFEKWQLLAQKALKLSNSEDVLGLIAKALKEQNIKEM